MGKQLTCEKCGEVIDRDKEKVHKIFCYAWVDDEHNWSVLARSYIQNVFVSGPKPNLEILQKIIFSHKV